MSDCTTPGRCKGYRLQVSERESEREPARERERERERDVVACQLHRKVSVRFCGVKICGRTLRTFQNNTHMQRESERERAREREREREKARARERESEREREWEI